MFFFAFSIIYFCSETSADSMQANVILTAAMIGPQCPMTTNHCTGTFVCLSFAKLAKSPLYFLFCRGSNKNGDPSRPVNPTGRLGDRGELRERNGENNQCALTADRLNLSSGTVNGPVWIQSHLQRTSADKPA